MHTRFESALLNVSGDAWPRPHRNCYWLIGARVLAGEYPGADDPQELRMRMRALVGAGLTRCFDLTHAGEALPPYAEAFAEAAAQRGMQASSERHAVADFGVPSVPGMRATLAAVDAALASGANVYIHCRAGIGRTGTLAGCLLVEQGLSGAQALAALQAKWQVVPKRAWAPHSPETREQREFIARWSDLRLTA